MCLSCNTDKDLKCAYDPDRTQLCYNFCNVCYSRIVNGTLYRGCVGDDKVVDYHSSSSYTKSDCKKDKNCEICVGAYSCNDRLFSDTCIKCSGSGLYSDCHTDPDPDRKNGILHAMCSLQSLSSSDGCYLQISDGTYQRGCVTDLSYLDQVKCKKKSHDSQQHKADCQICNSPNCNQKNDFNITCHQCNGEFSAQCIRGEDTIEIPCNEFSKICATGIDANGFSHRDCIPNQYSSKSAQFPNGFQKCYKNLCNDDIFPKRRTQCYHCDGIDCKYGPQENETSILKPCLLERDICYTYIKSGIHETNLHSNV